MNLSATPLLPAYRWVIERGVLFALLGLLALAGELSVTSAFALSGVTITPSPIAFTGKVGPGPLTTPVTFKNSGTSSVSFTWTDSISWISAGHPGGTLSPGQSVTYNMTAKISGMAAGSYSGIATVTAGGITTKVSITLTLSSGSLTPAIGLNTTSLGYAGTVGGTNPAAQTIGISNVGGGTVSWTASDSTAWLALSPVSGTNSGTVTASVNLTGLAAGTYNATISITATGATTKTVPVTLTVTASTSSGTGFSISPTTLAYTATVGSADKTGSVTVKNTGTKAITVTWADSINWLYGITPGFTQTIQPGLSGTYTLKARLANLTAGSYSGTATISGGGITKPVPATLTLKAVTSATNAASLAWKANTDSDLAGYKVYKGTSSGAYTAPVATVPKTTTSYTVAGLQTGTTYFFVITAYDTAGNESSYSSEVSKSIY